MIHPEYHRSQDINLLHCTKDIQNNNRHYVFNLVSILNHLSNKVKEELTERYY